MSSFNEEHEIIPMHKKEKKVGASRSIFDATGRNFGSN